MNISTKYKSYKIKASLLMLAVVMLQGCSFKSKEPYKLPFYSTFDLTPAWLSEDDPRLDTMHTVGDFSFTNQDGKIITAADYSGKIFAANFFFTTCTGICPSMTKNLHKIQDKYKDDKNVSIISYSVMPWIDTPERLKDYAQTNGIINSKWNLVTGNKADVYNLAWYSYLVDENPGFSADSSEFVHTENIMLVDAKGRIRGIYNGTLQLEMERMISDIEELKKE